MKKYFYLAILLIFCILTCACMYQCSHIKSLNDKLDTSTANEKALFDRLTGAQNDMVVYSNTIINLKHSQDSITKELISTKEKLKIRDKELLAMGSMNSVVKVTDTLRIFDTIFKEPDFALDTCISDGWSDICVDMKYPNHVGVESVTRSDKSVFVTMEKEYKDTPSKCFFIRWFQKKVNVIRVKVDEKNPHIVDENNIFIRIID